jgi:hypothetical protein
MDFLNIETVADLKKCGELEDLVDALLKIVSPFKIEASSYEELLPYVQSLRNFRYDDFFISKEAKLIFAILYVETEKRADLLGITEDLYESLSAAKEWFSSIMKTIHPDKCDHPEATKASSELNKIYKRMRKHGK